MNYHLINIAISLLCFGVFCFLQALFINGVKGAMDEGMILEGFKKYVQKKLGDYWSKSWVGCIRCMASGWSAVTFWPAVLIGFGFEWWEVPLFVANVFILVCVNFYIYKKT